MVDSLPLGVRRLLTPYGLSVTFVLSSFCSGHIRLYTENGIVDTLAPVSNSILTWCPLMEVSSIMAGTLADESESICARSSVSSLLLPVEAIPSECVRALF